MTDKNILKIYMEGFNNELAGTFDNKRVNSNLDGKAYVMGSFDALHGDDIRSVDYQSNEEILKRIRNDRS